MFGLRGCCVPIMPSIDLLSRPLRDPLWPMVPTRGKNLHPMHCKPRGRKASRGKGCRGWGCGGRWLEAASIKPLLQPSSGVNCVTSTINVTYSVTDLMLDARLYLTADVAPCALNNLRIQFLVLGLLLAVQLLPTRNFLVMTVIYSLLMLVSGGG